MLYQVCKRFLGFQENKNIIKQENKNTPTRIKMSLYTSSYEGIYNFLCKYGKNIYYFLHV